jgi:predicted nucleic acid-binding protein
MGVLVDTGVWVSVAMAQLTPDQIERVTGDEPVFMSPVTLAELRYGAELAPDAALRVQRLAALERLKRRPLLTIGASTADVFGLIAAQLRQAGKIRQRVQDLWLASQAIEHGYTILTENVRDFADIPGLRVVPVGAAAKG